MTQVSKSSAEVATGPATDPKKGREYPRPSHRKHKVNRLFIGYNITSAILYSIVLIVMVAWSPYLESASPTNNISLSQLQLVLLPTLATMTVAGAAGGVLCNLRGIFKHNAEEGEFPHRYEIPFVVRPFTGAVSGLFTFFLGNLVTASLSDASSQTWASLGGRLPYIAVALLAGFGSQEFMERLRLIAGTTFAEPTPPAIANQVKIAEWTQSDQGINGPVDLTPAGIEELILLHGDIMGDGRFQWHLFRPHESIYKPLGNSVAVKIFGASTGAERLSVAEEIVAEAAKEKKIADWRNREVNDWNPDKSFGNLLSADLP